MSLPKHTYDTADCLNETDLTGEYVENNYLGGIFAAQNEQAIEIESAREAAEKIHKATSG